LSPLSPAAASYRTRALAWAALGLAVGAVALAACHKPAPAKSAEMRTPPSLSPRFYAPDGWTATWLGLPGHAPVRYGVAAPTGGPRATVVIVASVEENAEVYFETARDLLAKGYTVWILDPAPTPDAGAEAVRSTVLGLVRPETGDTVILAGGRSAVLPILQAVERGPLPVSGVVLWTPKLSEPLAAQADAAVRNGQGSTAPTAEKAWVRPTWDITGRATLPDAWRVANPDLRPDKRPWNWFLAQAQAAATVTDATRLKALTMPVLLVQDRQDAHAEAACKAIAHCARVTVETSDQPPPFGADGPRGVWLKAFTGFVDDAIANKPHGV
jgi:lysophospholipase